MPARLTPPAASAADPSLPAPLRADLVLEGGGVKGLALAGAVSELARGGYSFPRVAGSSAGALTGAVVAALQAAGEPLSRLDDVVATLDLRRFRDTGGGLLGRVPLVGGLLAPLLSLVRDEGLYEGEYLGRWLQGVLGDLGVRTFGDLALPPDLVTQLPPERRYRLVVTASDVSRRRLVRFPWDYELYGLPPDEQEVVPAVRASTAIPFFFEPERIRSASGAESTLVDGGLLSNFPIALFDVPPGLRPAWPTFGVRLSESPALPSPTRQVDDPVTLGFALVDTFLTASDSPYSFDDCVVRRTVFADTQDVSAVDFGLTRAQQADLVRRGRLAASRFLHGWDLEAYVRDCRGCPPPAG